MKNIIYFALIVPALLSISGCFSMYVGSEEIDSLSEVGKDEIIVVGEISLNPPLSKDEQHFGSSGNTIVIGTSPFEGKVFFGVDKELFDMTKLGHSWPSRFGAITPNKVFFSTVKKASPLYYSGSILPISPGQKIYLTGGLKFHNDKNDKAIYIGSITYHRDEFGGITKVEIKDNYEKARKAFYKKFGKRIKLKKVKISDI